MCGLGEEIRGIWPEAGQSVVGMNSLILQLMLSLDVKSGIISEMILYCSMFGKIKVIN